MPKAKTAKAAKLKALAEEFPGLRAEEGFLYCKICSKVISADRRFQVKQHLESGKHIQLNQKSENKRTQQLFLPECSGRFSKEHDFHEKLCRAFVSADIPLYKMRNQHIRKLFEEYTDYQVPSETVLRSKHLKNVYNDCMDNIRAKLKNQFIWVSVDETIDATGRNVANVIVGALSSDKEIGSEKFLLHTAALEKTNYSIIDRLFDDAIKNLDVNFNKNYVLLFVTDAAPYMVKAAKAIAAFYPKVTHVTCIAHGLHRLCECIRNLYENVNKAIAHVKKVFLKAPCRVELFKQMFPDLALPPEPITTRWGTWLEAVNYYANNYENVLKVLSALNDEEAQSIKTAKDVLTDPKTKTDLICIACNYGFITKHIKKLQTSGLTLIDQVQVVEDTVKLIDKLPDSDDNLIVKKIESNYIKKPWLGSNKKYL